MQRLIEDLWSCTNRAIPILHKLCLISPNLAELLSLSAAISQEKGLALSPPSHIPIAHTSLSHINAKDAAGPIKEWMVSLIPHIGALISHGVEYVLLTLGEHGGCLCTTEDTNFKMLYMPALESNAVCCAGAGIYVPTSILNFNCSEDLFYDVARLTMVWA